MPQSQRIDWVDYAKGISIILVVMMHSTLSTEDALGHAGWLHGVVEFARPFRIPAFFMIAGLFVAHTIDRDWRTFLDRKVLHFVYFYVLWLIIQFAFRAPFLVADHGALGALQAFLTAFIDPYGTLWFIYLLPVFFLATRLTRSIPPVIVFLVAAALEIAPIDTHWTLIDEFASRFVYFYSGYLFSVYILRGAAWSRSHMALVLAGLAAWFLANLWLVHAGLSTDYGISLALGFAGAAAVVAISVLLARSHLLEGLRYCGQNSIVIYLAFFLPMVITRIALAKTHVITDPGTAAALVTTMAVVTPLILHWMVRGTMFKFLFERPARFHLVPAKPKKTTLLPAE
ncbi:acyltransferase family protein [Pseudorhodoplanes sinuspersici]|nr:acyltransferase family protein [Pseudorhodoplanes sinuspersici]